MFAIKTIPLRFRISIGLFVVSILFWLLGWVHFLHYFKFIHTQVRIADGVLTWVGPQPYVFTYEMWRPFVTSIALFICIAIYPLLRTPGGVFILAVVLNYLTCGMEFGNPFSGLFVLVFDIALFVLAAQRFSALQTKPLPPGRCVKCGYDLRATPTRCPECGTEVPVWLNENPPPE